MSAPEPERRPPGALRVTATRTVYENRWLRVREDETVLPDGSPGLYAVVEKPPAAVIVPRDGEHLWLVNQYRHTVRGRFWELPQGAWEDRPDAPGADVARGELAEETGLRAGTMERLGRLFYAYGFSDQPFEVWLATDLTAGEQQLEHTEQGLQMGRFTLAEVDAMVLAGRIRDAASVAALGLMRLRAGGDL
ncbi:MAG TPA: NUDIX hydrolase [Baekduia sp.]|uniref:NUDIX hydrolase n=1 Tax=Baekduia sp. TaxID=2600305 RepID=UPI002C08A178|nr:NUDIX hydrolase [Baekduia sp.]HMJ36066.1 NUDIX hydrolase [Baekduia sp.]